MSAIYTAAMKEFYLPIPFNPCKLVTRLREPPARTQRVRDEVIEWLVAANKASNAERQALGGFQLAANWESARQVGGDFYDAFPLGDDSLLLVVADVMGKGVPAAIFSTIMRSLVRAMAVWALRQLSDASIERARHLPQETDDAVRAEWTA